MLIKSLTHFLPSLTNTCMASLSHNPRPAIIESSMCDFIESSSLIAAAIPPCALYELLISNPDLVIIATLPYCDAYNADVKPASPLPITTVSNSNTCILITFVNRACEVNISFNE